MRQKLLLICLLMILVLCGFSQDLIVNGPIKDETNRPVEGATVTIKGTSTGAMTDALGKFTIKAQNGVFLVITHVAYEKAEQAVTSDQFDIVLKSNASKMDEVVVVGYG